MANASHAVLFDLDGTLVDTVYHHVRIWHDVLRKAGLPAPHWKVHRGIGLPSDRLLRWLLGDAPQNAVELTEEHDRLFLECSDQLSATDGALALLRDLEAREVPFLAVTSAGEATQKALFKGLGRDMPIAGSGQESKPQSDPIVGAMKQLGLESNQLTFIGDAVWDGEAARRSRVPFIGLRCGGFSDALLLQAGALWVEDAPRDLIGRL
jgi:HAD superfamily hydrolase (TIGR01549 family)